MTGKELILVLGGATALGAGAAGGYAVIQGETHTREAGVTNADLAEQIQRLANVQESNAKAVDDLRRSVSRLSDDVTQLQIEVAEAARVPAPMFAPPTDTPRVSQYGMESGGGGIEIRKGGGMLIRGGGATFDAESLLSEEAMAGLAEHLEKTAEGLSPEHREAMQGMIDGMKMRKLPEAERWQKAMNDVGLDYYQVEELKKAVVERDEAMKDAMIVEKSTTEGGANIVVKRPDFKKQVAARKSYDEKVDALLNEDQRTRWRKGGYDSAFGSQRGPMVFGVSTRTSETHDTEEIREER